MIRSYGRAQAAANEFALCSGILRLHLLEGVPFDRLAREYGYPVPRLREKLAAYVAACSAAIEVPPVTEPEIAPVAPPAAPPTIRIRERIRLAL